MKNRPLTARNDNFKKLNNRKSLLLPINNFVFAGTIHNGDE